MKILFQYFSKMAMCENAQEAEEFINSLHYRNHEHERLLIVNDYTRNLLSAIFDGKEQFQREIRTTNCGNTAIQVIQKPLGDTVEEHMDALKKIGHDREQKYLADIHAVNKGWYAVDVDVNIADLSGRRGRIDKTLHVETIACSKADAYHKVVQHYTSGADPEVVAPIFSEYFNAIFLGEKTDTGYSETDKLVTED